MDVSPCQISFISRSFPLISLIKKKCVPFSLNLQQTLDQNQSSVYIILTYNGPNQAIILNPIFVDRL